ncbi:hypothetical protein MIND_00877800 [Mycena indigotica]|uniref:Uncharacterized protein n=1 Tax=Mycena indigotica TaxID=2126181 RepID=A0A8H6W4U5_9AGAR|nr:uncharacterized protein MIND_00877800 [Mycena indigotica]KAF7299289.1 hypothetical protein MIND_00877800 [Mycena indigotica]
MFYLTKIHIFATAQFKGWPEESDASTREPATTIPSPTKVLYKARARLAFQTGKVVEVIQESRFPENSARNCDLDVNTVRVRLNVKPGTNTHIFPRFGSIVGRKPPGPSPLRNCQVAPPPSRSPMFLSSTAHLNHTRCPVQSKFAYDLLPPSEPAFGLTVRARHRAFK